MGLGTWLFGSPDILINGKRVGTMGKIADFLDGKWADEKLGQMREKNTAMMERYENMSDRELLRVFESYTQKGERYKIEFLTAAKLLKDRGIIDEHFNVIR